MHVFPGGMIDEGDSLSSWQALASGPTTPRWKPILKQFSDEEEFKRRIASVRETFEETNILLAKCASSFSHKLISSEDKHDTHWFSKYCTTHEVEPDLTSLVPFARWITPIVMKARFDSAFYLAPVQESQLAYTDCNPGEIDALDWFSPDEALSAYSSGRIKLAPPTYVKIAEMNTCEKYETLMNPASREMPDAILPVFVPASEDGQPPAIALPGDKDHPSTPKNERTTMQLRRMQNPGGAKQTFVQTPSDLPLLSNIGSTFAKKDKAKL